MKKILINASNISTGGGLQVANGIIQYLLREENSSLDCSFLVSQPLLNLIRSSGIDLTNKKIFMLPRVSFFSVFNPYKKAKFKAILGRQNPDLVYTIFGPFYYSVGDVKHIVGIAEPWILYSSENAWASLGLLKKVRLKFEIFLKTLILRKYVFLWTETEVAKTALVNKFSKIPINISVIPNKPFLLEYYKEQAIINEIIKKNLSVSNGLEIIYPAYPHVHKNFYFLIDVLSHFKQTYADVPFRIKLTLPKGNKATASILDYAASKNLSTNIINLGTLSTDMLVREYIASNLLFFPSLLEVSSATITEAMFTKTLVLAPDLFFNKEPVRGAAVFYSPNATCQQIADIIFSIFSDYSKYLHSIELSHSLANNFARLDTYKMHLDMLTDA